MTTIWAAKTIKNELAGTDDYSRGVLRRLKIGKPIEITVRQPRNGAMHKKFWALVNTVWQSTGDWPTPKHLLLELKLKLRLFDHVLDRSTGEMVKVLGSISYDSMDQAEFELFYERALGAMCEIAGGIERDSLRQAVLDELSIQ